MKPDMTKMGMEESMSEDEGEMMEERQEPAGEVSIFLSKDQLGNRQVSEGDTLSFTIASIDPETGDAELTLAGGGESERPSYADTMDKYMPEEET